MIFAANAVQINHGVIEQKSNFVCFMPFDNYFGMLIKTYCEK